MFERDIILVKQALQLLDRIFEYAAEIKDSDEFVSNYKTYDATLMNFVALGETVGKVSKEFRKLHNEIEWQKIYAFRNIIAHDYFGIDDEEVWGIIQKHLPILQTNLNTLLTHY